MRIVTACFLLLVVVGGTAIFAAGAQAAGRFEGIWKKCYEPGLEGVSEIDTGFLVLMPDSRYYELSASCCHAPPEPQPPFWSLDAYAVANDVVTLKAKRFDGSAYEIPMRYRASAKAVFSTIRGASRSRSKRCWSAATSTTLGAACIQS